MHILSMIIANVTALYNFGQFQYSYGKYSGAADYLYHFQVLSTVNTELIEFRHVPILNISRKLMCQPNGIVSIAYGLLLNTGSHRYNLAISEQSFQQL